MNVLPSVVCERCGQISMDCTYVQREDREAYAWWCEACVDGLSSHRPRIIGFSPSWGTQVRTSVTKV